MTVAVDMNPEQVEALGALTDMLVEVDRTISQLLAVKEGLLAVGSRLSMSVGTDAVAAAVPALTGSEASDTLELAVRAVAAEFATALHVSDRTVQRRMGDADAKVSRFPRVWRAQGSGRISAGQARVIIDAGMRIDDATDRDEFATQLIEHAEATAVAPTRLASAARRLAERILPRSLSERHDEARKGRRVWVKDLPDGMAELGIFGPSTLLRGVFDRLTTLAVTVGGDAVTRGESVDERGLDETRCDIALDLLLSGVPSGHRDAAALGEIRGAVAITVPATTLMGVDDVPAELDGRTPIDTATARHLAADAPGWDRVITHPITGAVLAVDRYRPSAALRRWLRERDQRCRFPGCGHPARDCDVDHTQDAAKGGATSAVNLSELCRRHHVLKHQTPWKVEQLDGGVLAWTSPTGEVYVDRPPLSNTITYAESDGSPPF